MSPWPESCLAGSEAADDLADQVGRDVLASFFFFYYRDFDSMIVNIMWYENVSQYARDTKQIGAVTPGGGRERLERVRGQVKSAPMSALFVQSENALQAQWGSLIEDGKL